MSSRSDPRASTLHLDPAVVRKARAPGAPGRAAGRRAGPQPHHGVRRAGRAAAGRAHRRRRRRHPVGQPAGRRRPRPTSAWSTGSRCRCGTRWRRGAADDLTHAGPEGRGRVGALPRARGTRRPTAARGAADAAVAAGIARIDAQPRASASGWSRGRRPAATPWIYLIVATGDIYEDIPQAQAAAREGADVIAVIRSTGQSLLDYVPEGATREGYAGTYATQENFRLMRAALDDVVTRARPLRAADQLRVRAVHAGDRRPGRARAARHDAQRLDVRDPLPRHQPDPHLRRPAVLPAGARPRRDHHQHRRGQLPDHRRRRRGRAHGHGAASCSTSTSPRRPGSRTGSWASGHAFEINPDLPESFRLELAHALLARELFPDAPLKWMPPTKHMTGDVFRGYLLDGFFNLAGALTGQGILLVGMMTEAVVTPWLSDRDLALQNVRYVLDAAGGLHRGLPPAAGRLHRARAPARCSPRRSTCSSGSSTTGAARRDRATARSA